MDTGHPSVGAWNSLDIRKCKDRMVPSLGQTSSLSGKAEQDVGNQTLSLSSFDQKHANSTQS